MCISDSQIYSGNRCVVEFNYFVFSKDYLYLYSCFHFYCYNSNYVTSIPENISTLFQRCLLVDTTSRRGATSNQRWNNVVYFNVGICNVKQRWINVVYFNVDINNVRQRRNNIVIFNVDMNNVGKRRNNVVKMTVSKKSKTNHFK